jgi:hypothetical protein
VKLRLPTAHRRNAVPLIDLPQLRFAERRTAVGRVALAAAAAGTLAVLFVVAHGAGAGRAAVFPEGVKTGVVVLDMSASIAGPTYARVATTLRGIVDANQSIGLVMFSDTAYELLPPNSPPGALREFIPYFVPLRYYGGTPVFGQTPWDRFMGGTRVAAGLWMGRVALRRAHVKHGAILLVSDLDDSNADQGALEQQALQLRQAHIPVRIVPLFPTTDDLHRFTALFGTSSLVDPRVFTHTAKRRATSVTAPQPWELLLLGALLVLLVAGNERWNGRLVVRGTA